MQVDKHNIKQVAKQILEKALHSMVLAIIDDMQQLPTEH